MSTVVGLDHGKKNTASLVHHLTGHSSFISGIFDPVNPGKGKNSTSPDKSIHINSSGVHLVKGELLNETNCLRAGYSS